MIDSLSLTENWIEMHENVCQFLVLFFFSSFSQFLSIFIHLVVKGNKTRRRKISEWNVQVAEEPQLGWFRKTRKSFLLRRCFATYFERMFKHTRCMFIYHKKVFFLHLFSYIIIYLVFVTSQNSFVTTQNSSVFAKKNLANKVDSNHLFWKRKLLGVQPINWKQNEAWSNFR